MACTQFDEDRITRLRNLIIAYDEAILALITGGVLEYSIDTGQSVQRVKRQDVPKLQEAVGLLTQQLDALEQRCGYGGVVRVTPGTMRCPIA